MRVPTNFNDFIYKDARGNHWLRFWKCFFSTIALREERNNCMIPSFIHNIEGARKVIITGSVVQLVGYDDYPIEEGRDIEVLKKIHTAILRNLNKADTFPEELATIVFNVERDIRNWLWETHYLDHSFLPQNENSNPRLLIKNANQWLQNCGAESVSPLWSSLWFEREICCLFAEANVGKSIYAVQMACEIARSKTVLYIDYEMEDTVFKKRYSDAEGNLFSFPDNFLRAQLNPFNFSDRKLIAGLYHTLDSLIEKNMIQVIILDNLTFLTEGDNSGLAISRIIRILKKLRDKHSVSFLIIAHAKRSDNSVPVSYRDIFANPRLFQFVDSCFAIVKSESDNNLFYLKQLKARNSEIEFGSDNVLLLKREKTGAFLHFKSVGRDDERKHLFSKKNKNDEWLRHNAVILQNQKLSLSEIAEKLSITKSKVFRLLKK